MILVWHQGQGHCKFKVIPELNCQCLVFYHEADGGLSAERHSSLNCVLHQIRFYREMPECYI